MPYLFWNIIGLAIIIILALTTKGKKNRHNKTHSIIYGILIAVMSALVIVGAMYQFGYKVGSDMAKRDNRADTEASEQVPPE